MDVEKLLGSRPARRKELGAWYAQLLEAAGREGISVRGLAERIGCSRETLYSWGRRRRKAIVAEGEGRMAGLVQVRVAEPEPERLEVRTRTGRSVFVPARFDASTLAVVVSVLERC